MGGTQAKRKQRLPNQPRPNAHEDVRIALALSQTVSQLGGPHQTARLPEHWRKPLRDATAEQLQLLIIEAAIRLRHSKPTGPSSNSDQPNT